MFAAPAEGRFPDIRFHSLSRHRAQFVCLYEIREACKDGRWNYPDFGRRPFDVNQIKSTVAGMRTGATIAFIAIVCGVFAASSGWSALTGSIAGKSRLQDRALQLAAEPATAPAPPSETDEEDDK